MTRMESKGRAFRRLLEDEPYLFTGGIYSPLDAQIAERAGMKSIYLSGYSVAMLNGWPDMGFLTQTEVTRIGAMVASAVRCPSSPMPTTDTAMPCPRCAPCRSS
jgi:isocitrate lyase